jgi:hypothetical protein
MPYKYRPKFPMRSDLVQPQTEAFVLAVREMPDEFQRAINDVIDHITAEILIANNKYFRNRSTARADAVLFVSKLVHFGTMDKIEKILKGGG